MLKSVLGRTAIEYAKLKSNTHIMCLFPIAHTRMDEVMNIINEYSNVFYHSSETLNGVLYPHKEQQFQPFLYLNNL